MRNDIANRKLAYDCALAQMNEFYSQTKRQPSEMPCFTVALNRSKEGIYSSFRDISLYTDVEVGRGVLITYRDSGFHRITPDLGSDKKVFECFQDFANNWLVQPRRNDQNETIYRAIKLHYR